MDQQRLTLPRLNPQAEAGHDAWSERRATCLGKPGNHGLTQKS